MVAPGDDHARSGTGVKTLAQSVAAAARKNVTLAIAQALKAKIDAEPNMRAVLTRDSDFFVPLHQRAAEGAARAVRSFRLDPRRRLHQPDARRSVFVLSGERGLPVRQRAGWRTRNAADLIGGVNFWHQDPMARTLLDLSQTATINDSLKLGGGARRTRSCRRPAQAAGRAGWLRRAEGAGHPVDPGRDGLHIESEERRLNDEAYQDKLAEAVMSGIRKYFEAQSAARQIQARRLD